MTSNKPIPFDAKLCQELVELFRSRHGAHFLSGERLSVKGELSHGHALATLVLEKTDRSSRLELATCVELKSNHLENPIDARDIALDFLDVTLGEFLSNDRMMYLPPVWQTQMIEDQEILLRGASTRPALDDEAAQLLAEAGFDANGDPL